MNAVDAKPIEIFNTLIGINNNRIECYRFVTKQTDSGVLRSLFSRLAETSLFYNEMLATEVYKIGGKPQSGTLSNPAFFASWLKMHSALMRNDKPALVEACYEAERAAIYTYHDMIVQNEDFLNTVQLEIIKELYELITVDFSRVCNLRSVYKTAA